MRKLHAGSNFVIFQEQRAKIFHTQFLNKNSSPVENVFAQREREQRFEIQRNELKLKLINKAKERTTGFELLAESSRG